MIRPTTALFALCAALSLTGCPPPEEGLGALDTLGFAWDDPALGHEPIHRPLAVGALGVVQVTRRYQDPPQIRDVRSTDDATLRVISIGGDRVYVEALAVGESNLEVFSDRGNDWITLTVQPVERVHLEPRFSAIRQLLGGVDVMGIQRFGPHGGELVGTAPVEVSFEPPDAGITLPAPAHELRLRYDRAGEVRVRADGAERRRIVVEPDSVSLLAVYDVPGRTVPQMELHLGLAVYDREGVQLGALDQLLEITPIDEGVCDIRLEADLGVPQLIIETRQPGICGATLTLGGQSEAFEFTVDR